MKILVVDIDLLDNGNNQQRDFLKQIDEGVDLFKTNYYRRLKSYRQLTSSKQQKWSLERLAKYMHARVALYKDIQKNGLLKALEVGKNNRIIDGNHRHAILKHLGYKTVLIKKT